MIQKSFTNLKASLLEPLATIHFMLHGFTRTLQFSPNFIAPQYDIETYEGHLQGDLKLIIPEKVFQSPLYNRIFKAYAILTSIDDHWGDTVELECRVLRD